MRDPGSQRKDLRLGHCAHRRRGCNRARQALEQALTMAGIAESDLGSKVYTGYGREFLGDDGAAVTEITCHARGAHHLDPAVRTVIDIGGQDSKVIRLSESGAVETFAMNDKCAAGTGRFWR